MRIQENLSLLRAEYPEIDPKTLEEYAKVMKSSAERMAEAREILNEFLRILRESSGDQSQLAKNMRGINFPLFKLTNSYFSIKTAGEMTYISHEKPLDKKLVPGADKNPEEVKSYQFEGLLPSEAFTLMIEFAPDFLFESIKLAAEEVSPNLDQTYILPQLMLGIDWQTRQALHPSELSSDAQQTYYRYEKAIEDLNSSLRDSIEQKDFEGARLAMNLIRDIWAAQSASGAVTPIFSHRWKSRESVKGNLSFSNSSHNDRPYFLEFDRDWAQNAIPRLAGYNQYP